MIMDLMTLLRSGLTVAMLVIFAGIVWWAYGGKRAARFDEAAHSVLREEATPGSPGGKEISA
jgi:cytochrome c oxidase cbb3-type subunit IV